MNFFNYSGIWHSELAALGQVVVFGHPALL